jgi:hypothetical protein
MKISYLSGNLIDFAKEGKFDVVVVGRHCFCSGDSALLKGMHEAFSINEPDFYPLEHNSTAGDINKLGQIDWCPGDYSKANAKLSVVVNAYVMYSDDLSSHPFDYQAYQLCLRKINHEFEGLHIGMPKIGCHLAGGDWDILEGITEKELKDCTVTIVNYGTQI